MTYVLFLKKDSKDMKILENKFVINQKTYKIYYYDINIMIIPKLISDSVKIFNTR